VIFNFYGGSGGADFGRAGIPVEAGTANSV